MGYRSNEMNQETQYLPPVRTPAGNPIRFALPQDTGGEFAWWRFKLSVKHITGKAKQFLPKLGLWNAGDGYFIIAADFDRLPAHLGNAKVASILDANCPEALVTASVSGNVKGFFMVKAARMDVSIAKAFLLDRIPAQLHPYLDASCGASRLFVNERLYRDLADWAPCAPVTDILGTESSIIVDSGQYRYFSTNEALPEFAIAWVNEGMGGTPEQREALIRILLSMWNLKGGFQLPTTTLSAQIGCSPRLVGNMLKDLRIRKLLYCVDAAYTPGRHAKTYKASGLLLEAIQGTALSDEARASRKRVRYSSVIPGMFYLQCLQTLPLFSDSQSFLQHVSAWDGVDMLRLKEATRYAACEYRNRVA
jgi:hypothetical protein